MIGFSTLRIPWACGRSWRGRWRARSWCCYWSILNNRVQHPLDTLGMCAQLARVLAGAVLLLLLEYF